MQKNQNQSNILNQNDSDDTGDDDDNDDDDDDDDDKLVLQIAQFSDGGVMTTTRHSQL